MLKTKRQELADVDIKCASTHYLGGIIDYFKENHRLKCLTKKELMRLISVYQEFDRRLFAMGAFTNEIM